MTIQSTNWSGYVQSTNEAGTFTEVSDTFVVPTITAMPKGVQYAADWVGIGGYSSGDSTLVQDGIQAFVRTKKHHTTVSYDAWTEHLPQVEKPLDLTISPGDTVTAIVQETTPDHWLMKVTDDTTGSSDSSSVIYTSSGESVEAIHERPCIKSPCTKAKDLAHLAQTTNVTFAPGTYSVAPAGTTPVPQPLLLQVAGQSLDTVNMINNQGAQIATSSNPSTASDGFVVADGSSKPAPPST
jgi:hypothetical protein